MAVILASRGLGDPSAMAKEIEVTKASASDIAADMEHHRVTYGRFFRGIAYISAALAVVLFLLFVTLN